MWCEPTLCNIVNVREVAIMWAVPLLGAATLVMIWAMIKKDAPRVSGGWLVSTLVNLASALAQLASEPGSLALIMPLVQLGSTAIIFFVAWYKKRGVELTKFDMRFLALAGLGLVLWWTIEEPLLAVVACVVANVASTMPQLRSARLNPQTTPAWYWLLRAIANSLAALAVWGGHLESSLPQTVGVVMCSLVWMVCLLRPSKSRPTLGVESYAITRSQSIGTLALRQGCPN